MYFSITNKEQRHEGLSLFSTHLFCYIFLFLQHCYGDQGERNLPKGHAEIHTEQGQYSGQYPLCCTCAVLYAGNQMTSFKVIFKGFLD